MRRTVPLSHTRVLPIIAMGFMPPSVGRRMGVCCRQMIVAECVMLEDNLLFFCGSLSGHEMVVGVVKMF